MRPRGCLRPAPPSTECGGGRCALAAGRLPSGASLFGRVSMSGAVVRYPPLFADMTARRGFQVGCGPTPRGDASGARRRRGSHRPARAGLSPCPLLDRGGRRTSAYVFLFEGCCAGRVFYICLVFGLLVSLQAASPCHFPEKRWPHSLPAVVLPLRNVGTELCINYCTSVQFWLHTRALPAQTQVCSQQLRAQTTTRRHSAPSKQKCPTF